MRSRASQILKALVFVSLSTLSSIALGSSDFGKQLENADSLRSADPKKFDVMLQQLDKDAANATADELELLRYLQAYRLGYIGQYNLAIQKATAIFQQTGNINLKYRSALLISNSYAVSRDFSSSFSYLDKALLLQEKISDPTFRHDGLTVAALLYNQAGQYDLARKYSEKMLSDNPSPRTLCFANHMLLEALYNLDKLPESDAPINTMIDSCSEHGEVLLANMSRVFLARKWVSENEPKKSIDFMEKYLAETESTGYARVISEVHAMVAELKLKSGQLEQAKHHADIAVERSATIPFSPSLVIAERTLYEIAMRRKDTAAALEHYKKYAEADKAYLNDVKARELAYQLVKHETQQKNQTIDLLNKKNEVLQLEQTVAKQNERYTAVLVGLLALLLTILLLWTYRTKRMQMAFRRLAETDALTGISNRDHFTKLAEQAISDASKKSEQLGMIMFDLDNFKSINDHYGHSTGDWVLKQVIAACKPICRKHDCFGRIGGEEFAILLHASDLSSSSETADRFRKQIAAIDTSETGHDFSVTASFGVTTAQLSGYVFDTLLSNADQALYQSKREGRNRVSTYDMLKSNADIAEEAAIGL